IIPTKPRKQRNNKICLLLPQNEIFLYFNIIGVIIIAGKFKKKIISIKGKYRIYFTKAAERAKKNEAIIIIKIPNL
ncbi:unnamed protein product, partial [marine sediment metagenome]